MVNVNLAKRVCVPLSRLRVLLGLQPLSVNSTRSLLRSGLPAFGTTTAYTLRVLREITSDLPACGLSRLASCFTRARREGNGHGEIYHQKWFLP